MKWEVLSRRYLAGRRSDIKLDYNESLHHVLLHWVTLRNLQYGLSGWVEGMRGLAREPRPYEIYTRVCEALSASVSTGKRCGGGNLL
jgi:hypothetical protein